MVRKITVKNKTKDGVEFFLNGQKVKMGWDQFKKDFEPIPGESKFRFQMTQEAINRYESLNQKIDRLVVLSYMNNDEPVTLLEIGTLTEELSKAFGCSIPEVVELVRKRRAAVNPFGPIRAQKHARTKSERLENQIHMSKCAVEVGSTTEKPSTFEDLPGADKLKNLFKK